MGRNKFFKTEFILRIEKKQQRHRRNTKEEMKMKKRLGMVFMALGMMAAMLTGCQMGSIEGTWTAEN